METVKTGRNSGWNVFFSLALPISLQSLFQASFSVIDQVMVGQLGTDSVAAIGLGANFANMFTITLAAIGTAASIMIAQYCGNRDVRSVNHAFFSSSFAAAAVTMLFLLPSLFLSGQILSLYTTDAAVIEPATGYLRIVGTSFPAMLVTAMLSALLRNTGRARLPMITGIISVGANTLLNYLLIFGKFGMPAMGVSGAALATSATRFLEAGLLLLLFLTGQSRSEVPIRMELHVPPAVFRQTLAITGPIVANEFLWGLGQTAYAVIYGRMGTDEMAAVTLTQPVQGLLIELFTGVSTAASILVGNSLGKSDNDAACRLSERFVRLGAAGSGIAGILLCIFAGFYSGFFSVSQTVKTSCTQILYVFAVVLFVKVSNMILGGGILRSGGKTHYTLYLDLLGTWAIGVPLGVLAAFIFHLPVHWVYFMISLEEIVRLYLEIRIFRSRRWIKNITAAA